MDYLSVLLLYLFKRLDGQRSMYGALHILNGKRSVQPIQDSRFFGVRHMYGLIKRLKREAVEREVVTLEKYGLIEKIGPDCFKVTSKGNTYLESELIKKPLPQQLNQFNSDITSLFWRRLALTVQTVSFLLIKKQFIPVSKDPKVQQWVKRFLISKNEDRKDLAKNFYEELLDVLTNLSNLEATILTLRLSSSERVGLTNEQVSEDLKMDHYYLHVLFQGILQQLVQMLTEKKEQYPLLSIFIQNNDRMITETAEKTFSLVKKGFGLEEISKIRKLKINTIEDHIVEIALNKHDFNIDRFVSIADQQKIKLVLKHVSTRRLSEIKKSVGDDISYFSIRLTLAKKESDDES